MISYEVWKANPPIEMSDNVFFIELHSPPLHPHAPQQTCAKDVFSDSVLATLKFVSMRTMCNKFERKVATDMLMIVKRWWALIYPKYYAAGQRG